MTHHVGTTEVLHVVPLVHAKLSAFGSSYTSVLRRHLDRARGLGWRVIVPDHGGYEHPAPGEMLHVDVKKVGRIPDGGGWAIHGRGTDEARASRRVANHRPGYVYIHAAVDDHSRMAYAEVHPDEQASTAAGSGSGVCCSTATASRPSSADSATLPLRLHDLAVMCKLHELGDVGALILRFGPCKGSTLAQIALRQPDYLRQLATRAQRPEVRAAAARVAEAMEEVGDVKRSGNRRSPRRGQPAA